LDKFCKRYEKKDKTEKEKEKRNKEIRKGRGGASRPTPRSGP
jgi:hypothetical protein